MVHRNLSAGQGLPTPEFLDKAEMQQLTGRAQVNKQQEWLEAQGIAHRRDGARLIVSRHHVRRWLEGEEQPRPGSGINWAALNEPSASRPESQRAKDQHAEHARRAALWAYYAHLVDTVESRKLACPEFHRIATEGRASTHFAKCDACLALRARYFPKA